MVSIVVIIAFAAAYLAQPQFALAAEKSAQSETFSGFVYDIDYIENLGWCQVLIRKDNTSPNLVVITKEHRMQTILETSVIRNLPVEVSYKPGSPGVLTRVKLNIP